MVSASSKNNLSNIGYFFTGAKIEKITLLFDDKF